MNATLQKALVSLGAIALGIISIHFSEEDDFIWNVKNTAIPVLIALLALFSTLSMNLVRALDELPDNVRAGAMEVIDAMKYELRLELVLLVVTFVLIVVSPFFKEMPRLALLARGIIDSLVVADIVLFLIDILDTFFGYLDFLKIKD